ncbi:uncharacterized protein DS421_14g453210 [Arachis hypogaea]|nr:uncharacterized protein DS421_14g453210 [Arachis hypogaea]
MQQHQQGKKGYREAGVERERKGGGAREGGREEWGEKGDAIPPHRHCPPAAATSSQSNYDSLPSFSPSLSQTPRTRAHRQRASPASPSRSNMEPPLFHHRKRASLLLLPQSLSQKESELTAARYPLSSPFLSCPDHRRSTIAFPVPSFLFSIFIIQLSFCFQFLFLGIELLRIAAELLLLLLSFCY